MKYKINEKQLTYKKVHPFQVPNSSVRSPEPHPVAAGISSRVLMLSYKQCVCPAGDLSGVSVPMARVGRAPRGPLQPPGHGLSLQSVASDLPNVTS